MSSPSQTESESKRLTTAKALITHLSALDTSSLAALFSDSLKHEFRPSSISVALPTPLTKESYLGFLSNLASVMTTLPFTIKDIVESEKDNKVVLWASSRANFRDELKDDEGVGEEGWEFEAEYVFILTMDGEGRIVHLVEFMDILATVERAVKLLEQAGKNLAKVQS
ncbi:hypothetical protein BJX70DRAFT_94534 [Aspergillus crustosus]